MKPQQNFKKIIKFSSVPIVADIHFHYLRAIEAADAGAACLRINPGNIGDVKKVREVISSAKQMEHQFVLSECGFFRKGYSRKIW